ncbi:hypothetical protein N7494_006491 [Penicillium frequentans]|uniref:CFEM domain-containing protein n=1 Tax=Penicillium frequentans TaxID=3151616 RepID=A0AAD6CWD1_9EURO|nr:hypothetical protein N7494_006491 [Penicillium glabrum]
MLLHPVYRILAAALLLVAFCVASSDTSDVKNAALWDMVPDCARNCTENFIQTEYTTAECSDKSNIKCLCRSRTPSNLTIGEAALTCVYALCSEKVKKNTDVYHICDSVSGHLAETHATLTATTFAPASSTTTSTTAEVTTSSTTKKHSAESTTESETSTSTTSTSITSDPAAEITSYHPSTSASEVLSHTSSDTSTTTPTNPSTSATGKNDSHHVSPGIVIGVSVVSGVAGCFIIGVAVFFCAKRWRKKNQIDFEIGGRYVRALWLLGSIIFPRAFAKFESRAFGAEHYAKSAGNVSSVAAIAFFAVKPIPSELHRTGHSSGRNTSG